MANPYAVAIQMTAVDGVSPMLKTTMGGVLGLNREIMNLDKSIPGITQRSKVWGWH
jgi:hypothetical protein